MSNCSSGRCGTRRGPTTYMTADNRQIEYVILMDDGKYTEPFDSLAEARETHAWLGGQLRARVKKEVAG